MMRGMTRFIAPAVLAVCLLAIPHAQSARNPFLGRWDIATTSQSGRNPQPVTQAQWMELVDEHGTLSGRIQPTGGAVRDMVDARLDGATLLITVAAATASRPATIWQLTASGDTFTGEQKVGEAVTAHLAGQRAPVLNRPMPAAWTAPEALFNGKDLTGWAVVSNPERNKWSARDGDLVNDNPDGGGANLRTTRTFDDFKLHIEVNCPEHGNSGIYLRGRYEIQVGTEGGTQPSHEMGAIYGFFAPAVAMPINLGQWTTFDVTLVGRTVTVLRDGVAIHRNQELPGITGGALDSREGEPGPFFLQGDHQGVLRYRNITVSLPRR
jgi:3-keto-disaccharide hydrolase